jgi:hypothetical protein
VQRAPRKTMGRSILMRSDFPAEKRV